MLRVLRFSTETKAQLGRLDTPAHQGTLKQVRKALGCLQINPAHPSLNTHEFTSLSSKRIKVFEAYAQNNTPGAHRILWHYGPDELESKTSRRTAVITVVAILRHT